MPLVIRTTLPPPPGVGVGGMAVGVAVGPTGVLVGVGVGALGVLVAVAVAKFPQPINQLFVLTIVLTGTGLVGEHWKLAWSLLLPLSHQTSRKLFAAEVKSPVPESKPTLQLIGIPSPCERMQSPESLPFDWFPIRAIDVLPSLLQVPPAPGVGVAVGGRGVFVGVGVLVATGGGVAVRQLIPPKAPGPVRVGCVIDDDGFSHWIV